MSMRRDQNRLPAAANRNRQRRGWPGPSLAKNVWRSYGLVLLVAMSALIPFAGTAQDRTSTMEVRGREFLSRTPGGTAFQSTCARSVRATDAGTVFAEDATDAEIGGYCACMAAYLFSDKASLFHGRLSQVTQRAVAGSLMAGALQDAKVVGGENRAAMALGFYMEAQKDCFATHLDKQARKAAATRKATDELVKAQELPDRYGMEIEKAVAQNDGGTLLVCRSDESHWPNTPETLFVLYPMQSQGDYYDGLFTDAGFAEFIGEIGTRDTAEINAALSDIDQIANSVDTETFSDPYPMRQQGDFYRLPLFEGRKEIGHFCLSRAPNGRSYFAGNTPGGKLLEGLNALLGESDPTTCSIDRANNTRSFREYGGGLMSKCEVVAHGADVPARLRSALENRARRFKALPTILRNELQLRETKRQSDYRF